MLGDKLISYIQLFSNVNIKAKGELLDVPEQIRAHLGIGIACPIIGDIKYNFSRRETAKGIPPRLSDIALQDLNISGNSVLLFFCRAVVE